MSPGPGGLRDDDRGQKGRCSSVDLGPPDLPGPQPPLLLGGCHHNACLWGRCGVTGDDMSVGFAEQM